MKRILKMKQKISSKWLISNMLLFIFLLASLVYFVLPWKEENPNEHIEFVLSMGAGWNLGNALDSHGSGQNRQPVEIYETFWGNPKITEETILAVKEAGFKTVRIPVTWYEHMDKDGLIDVEWMDRVNDIVNYVIENDMYAIINIHHDRWAQPMASNSEKANAMLKIVWDQIATRFAKYDNHLIFEAVNEPRLIGTEYEWNAGTAEARRIVNIYNQTFIETVRSIPGNSSRYLMVAPYGDSPDLEAIQAVNLPDDKYLILTVHGYRPYGFTHDRKGTRSWDANNINDTREIDEMMANLDYHFIQKGIPVIIGEFGVIDKDNLKERLAYTKYYVSSARRYNIMCIWWDDSIRKDKKERFGILDRERNVFAYPGIAKVLVEEQPLPQIS
ncbi:glycoside hydrolase family 5 protein [Proteocatella sphenisci]|uniref:glycoside hydrolase family 5 protein n=1 Tax=Proteocatella sphenisci TaxID=181070 RepID=UPI000688CFB6|nr:glycoside hydrolase family 5 protein [Proteocatella sphenisci]